MDASGHEHGPAFPEEHGPGTEPTAQQRSPWLAPETVPWSDEVQDLLALSKAAAENDRLAATVVGTHCDVVRVAATAAKILGEMLRETERDGSCSHCMAQYFAKLAARP